MALIKAQANALEGLGSRDAGTSAYTISDSATTVAGLTPSNFSNATAIVVTGNTAGTLSVNQATTLLGIITDDGWTYSIKDDPDNIVAEAGTGLSSFITNSVIVTLKGKPTLAQLVAINDATAGDIILQTTSGALSETAADLITAFSETITEYTGDFMVIDAASVSQLLALDNATTGTVNYTSITDLSGNIVVDNGTGLTGYVTSTKTVNIQDQATLAQLKAINDGAMGDITLGVTSGTLTGSVADFGTGTDTISLLYGDGGIAQVDLRGDGTGYL